MRYRKNWPVVFVTMASPEQSDHFRKEMRSPHLFLSDPERKVYGALGLGKGNLGQMFNLRTLSRGLSAAKEGNRLGAPVGDPFQLGGAFVIDVNGGVLFAKPAGDASDIVQISDVASFFSALPSAQTK